MLTNSARDGTRARRAAGNGRVMKCVRLVVELNDNFGAEAACSRLLQNKRRGPDAPRTQAPRSASPDGRGKPRPFGARLLGLWWAGKFVVSGPARSESCAKEDAGS